MINPWQTQQVVSLVDRNGSEVAQAISPLADLEPVPFPGTATTRDQGCCPVVLPEVSTTERRVYFVSGQDELRYLDVDGRSGPAAHLPNVKGRTQAVFAVSPDDTRIAVAVFDWSRLPMKVTIYVENLGGGNRTVIFTSTSSYEWPVAWHAGMLVVAVWSANGGPNPYAATDYHVADAGSGLRYAVLGSSSCPVAGPLVAAGTACSGPCGADYCVFSVDWSGHQHNLYRYKDPNGRGIWASLSPNGQFVAVDEGGHPAGEYVVGRDGSQVKIPSPDSPAVWWMDDDTLGLFGLPSQDGVGTYINAAVYRLSTPQLIPLSGSLGQFEGVVPGLS